MLVALLTATQEPSGVDLVQPDRIELGWALLALLLLLSIIVGVVVWVFAKAGRAPDRDG